MIAELLSLAERCDGLRCDMAMLVLPDVFQKTWGIQPETFWRGAISRVRASHPDFTFLAEAYWGLEDELIRQGFDFTYDKGLYDSLVERNPDRVLEQIRLETPWIERRAHFLENHDEPRAAAVFPPEAHRAAALVTYLLPGLRFFQSGQERGFRLRPPVQFCRPPQESTDRWLSNFYALLLEQIQLTRCREGTWKMCACIPAWDGDLSWRNYVVFSWEGETGENWLAAVNFSDRRSYCYAQLEIDRLRGRQFRLHDVLNGTIYQRPDDQIAEQGLYLDRPAWGYHLFEIRQID